jgi:hypothetical protein
MKRKAKKFGWHKLLRLGWVAGGARNAKGCQHLEVLTARDGIACFVCSRY